MVSIRRGTYTAAECQHGNPAGALLPPITYLIVASNSLGASHRAYSQGDASSLAFVVFIYGSFLLIELCHSQYQKMVDQKRSLKKVLLRLSIWALFSSIMFAFSWQFFPLLHWTGGLTIYFISAASSAFHFYMFVIDDDDDNDDNNDDDDDPPKLSPATGKKVEGCDSLVKV